MQKHFQGRLNKICPHCHHPFEWVKINFIRPDGYFDWRLDVICPCGECLDPEIQKLAHEDYDETLTLAICEMHETELNKHLGVGLNRTLSQIAFNT